MHRDHEVFIEGIEQEKRLELTFFSRKHQRNVVSSCAPLHYSKGITAGDGMDCYYLWDFEAERGSNFLPLSASQIVSMKLTKEVFHVQEFKVHSETAKKST